MKTSKTFSFVLVVSVITLVLSGFGATQNALAQPQNPPTLSSGGESPPVEPLPEQPEHVFEGGPANDEYVSDGELSIQAVPPSSPTSVFGTESDGWIGSIPHGSQLAGSGIQSMVLYNNGPLVTHPSGGFNGADASALQTTLGFNLYGFSNQYSSGFRLADDFTINTAGGWEIDEITFFTYQTDTYPYPPASTITSLYLQIWDGSPDDPASTIVFGDMVTNLLVETYWTNIYRAVEEDLTNAQRPIMAAVAGVNITLPQGTYWLDWTVSGSGASGPFTAPITILGQTTTGNALQHSSGSWLSAIDYGNSSQQGIPFVIDGTPGDWLWEQPLSATNINAYVDQEFPDIPSFSSFISDDFVVDQTWKIDTIFVPGRGFGLFSTLMNATALTWRIYEDNNGVPAGDPSGGGDWPIWSLSLPPTDPRVTISDGFDGLPSNTLLSLQNPIKLPAGHYWLVFYPTMQFSPYGQFGLQPADTSFGHTAQFINPGGGFGYGNAWQNWTVLGPIQQDIAFSIGGTKGGTWQSIAPINSLGRSRPAAATVNGKIYLFGGETSSGKTDIVERYDPATNAWTILAASMPNAASNICAAVIGTDVYIPGGYDNAYYYLNTLRVYHTTSDTWTIVTTDPLPVNLFGMSCASLNNKIYVFGGDSGGIFQTAAYVYDPAAAAGSRWASIAPMANARAYLAGVVANGKIYAIGGLNASLPDLDHVEAFDPADGLWHSVTNLQVARGGVGAYAVGNTIYACGGGWVSYYDSCETYDTTQGYSGSWDIQPDIMLQGRRTFGTTNIGPVLYAIGGWNGNYLQTAERRSFDNFLPLTLK